MTIEVSKSQWESFATCWRRGAFKYIAGRKEPSNKYTAFGISGHALAEKWLAHGVLPQVNSLDPKSDESRAAVSLLAGIRYAPKPDHPGLGVEAKFNLHHDGVDYVGYRDACAPTAAPLIESPNPLVFDWKFTSDTKWALTAPELMHSDPQGIIYARNAFVEFPDALGVTLRWVYMVRGERIALPVTAHIQREANLDAMAKVVTPIAKAIVKLRTIGPDPNDLPPNYNACKKYGVTCPHIDVCKQDENSAAHVVASHFGGAPMSQSLDFLNGILGSSPIVAPLTSGLPAGATPPWAAPAAINPPTPAAPAVAPAPAPAPMPAVTAAPNTTGNPMVVFAGGTPFPAPADSAQLQTLLTAGARFATPEECAPKKRAPGRPKKETAAPAVTIVNNAAPAPTPAPTPVASDTPVAQVVQQPTPMQQTAPLSSVPTIGIDLGPVPAPSPSPAPMPEARAEVVQAYTLYVNSYPARMPGVTVVSASEIVARVSPEVCRDNPLPDGTVPVHYRSIGYGAGPGKLCYYLENMIRDGMLAGVGAVCVDVRTPEGADVVGVLERLAGGLVRGT